MPRLVEIFSRLRRMILGGCCLLTLCLATFGVEAAQETNGAPDAGELLVTNLVQYWSLPQEERTRPQHARMEFLIYFCDTNWNMYWGSSDGLESYLPFHDLSTSLKFGDKVVVDGMTLPMDMSFVWDKTSIKILSESNHIEAVSAKGKLLATKELKLRYVEFEALVDSSQVLTPSILRLNLVAEDNQIDAFVHLDDPGEVIPNFEGKRVRIRGVYSASLDPFGKVFGLVLWTPGLNQIETIGPLEDDPRFSIPISSSDDLTGADSTELVRVAGVVRSQQPGEGVTIWDEMGQIQILAKQRQPLKLGDYIEAIGYPESSGYDRLLHGGLYRIAAKPSSGQNRLSTNGTALHLAGRVLDLNREQITSHPRVSLDGEVTWVSGRTNFIYIQDSSGGIRVMLDKSSYGKRLQPGMLVTVDGVAAMGEYAPVITNAVLRQTGNLAMPLAPLVSFEQALAGTEDGRWIQMRGYVRKATEVNGHLDLQLMAPGGEFVAHVPKEDAGQAPPGSVVLLRGVCVAIANSRRQLTGIELWSGAAGFVQTEQLPPTYLYDGPQQSIGSLRQFSSFNTLNKRVHTSGTVTLQVLGHYLYLQDGDSSLLALSQSTEPMLPGDRAEIVGFSGNDGGSFLLREAVYRRIGIGPEPAPVHLARFRAASEDLDGLLVSTEGLLLDVTHKASETRLILQVNGHVIEAKSDDALSFDGGEPEPNSKLTVTGVYQIQRDEYGKPMSFLLNLRTGKDIRVLEPPPWWTARRVWFVLFGGVPVFLLAVFSATLTRRKNRLLQAAQIELKNAHGRLEERVEERTKELNEEVEARKQAHERLSEAQQRLIVASRQAGMAEVATGVLHNIGNILNSVNISASVISEYVQRLRVGKFSKAVELLKEHDGRLPGFLTDDPRGRALPGYLSQLADNMVQSEKVLQSEVNSLTKQIDHVKAVVTWQQGYARSSGFYEDFKPAELMEDAFRINQEEYALQGIDVVREYGALPVMKGDRHKILQILINLMKNARQALPSSGSGPRRVVLGIHADSENRVRFEISDSGMGVAPENLERIFSLGFTTKPNGHGFGLHSGANSAKEMGGRLFAASDGPGRGSTFVLELPMTLDSGQAMAVNGDVATKHG